MTSHGASLTGALFPAVLAHSMSLGHSLVILTIFQIFHYYDVCCKYKTWMDEELFLTDEQRKWFVETESTSGKE